MALQIRPAVLADANAIAAVHTRVWRATYGDIAPKKALQNLTLAHRQKDWKDTLSSADPACATLLAMRQNTVAGFVHFCVKNPQDVAVIKNLYIDQSYQRQGVGQALMHHAFAYITAKNCNAAELAVVESNAKALAFYQALGGEVQPELVVEGFFWRSSNRIIRWNDLK